MRWREKIDLTMVLTLSSVQRPCAGLGCSMTEAEPEGGGGEVDKRKREEKRESELFERQ